MVTRKRITAKERARREEAYRIWVKTGKDFAATAAAIGENEAEVRRWDRVHKWWSRWIDDEYAELARLQRLAAETQQLMPLINGVQIDGQTLHVPTEIAIEAVGRVFDIMSEAGGEVAEMSRAMLIPLAVDALHTMAEFALGVGLDGNPLDPPIDPEVKAEAGQALIDRGMATAHEIKTLNLVALVDRIDERVRARGIETGLQA